MPMMAPPSGPGSANPTMMGPPPGGSAPPGMGGMPPMDPGMMAAAPGGAPSTPDSPALGAGAPEAPTFEDAMAELVQNAIPHLDPNDLKVLAKIGPMAWTLSKIFGPKAVTMLEMAASKAATQPATAPMGPSAGQTPASQPAPTSGLGGIQ